MGNMTQLGHPLGQMMVARLVEVAWMPVRDWPPVLRAWGLQPVAQPDGTLMIETLSRGEVVHRTAVLESLDPTTRAVCLALAVAGAHWPVVFPGLLERVDREYKRRQRAETERLMAQLEGEEVGECTVPIAVMA